MNTKIEVCTKAEESTTIKGHLLEKLIADILKCLQYEAADTVRLTGIEVDVLAKHKFSSEKIFVECKAWDNALPADVITKLIGNCVVKNIETGWLVSTGPLSKDAEGLKIELEEAKRNNVIFYTKDRIIDLLTSTKSIKSIDSISEKIREDATIGNEALLMITSIGMYWVIPVTDSEIGLSSAVLVFDAVTGKRIKNTEKLNELKIRKNSFSGFQWIGEDPIDDKVAKGLKEEYNNIVPVISGDDWTDYRPARPEDFVGRRRILNNIFEFWEKVNCGKSRTRLFSIKAPSGMGKSSVVLKAVSMAAKNRKYNKKFFVFAVDVRTAVSARYAEMALKACFDAADINGFTDVTKRSVNSMTINQFLHDESIEKTLSYLNKQGKTIIIIFDQFEELFSKKELFPLFDSVKKLCNEVDSLQGQLMLGFAWKTDLTIPVEHPAYYMWSDLVDRRKEFELQQFKPTEIKSAIGLFGKQLKEQVNPLLANYLTKQCQGYPWLLKKLCIHVFKLIRDGNSQDYVIGQRLNIVDLFERDIAELTPDQHACVLEIAKNSPADYFSIAETYGNEMVQALINARIVIRRASKLTLYWDIFRDYVLNHVTPELLLDYIPQLQIGSAMRAFVCLLEYGDMTSLELSKKLDLRPSTIDNFMIDAVMFGVAQKNNSIIHIIPDSKEKLILQLQLIFRKHIIYNRLQQQGVETFDYGYFQKNFYDCYSDANLKHSTKELYCSKLYSWFLKLRLIVEENDHILLMNNKTLSVNINTLSNTKHQMSGARMFYGQSTPEKVVTVYKYITGRNMGYNELKKSGYRGALEILFTVCAVSKSGDTLKILCSLEDVFHRIKENRSFKFVQEQLANEPKIKGTEIGNRLDEKFSMNWSSASKMRYGRALLRWVKRLDG